MQKYEIKYKAGPHVATTTVTAANDSKAIKALSLKHPDIGQDQIVSFINISTGLRVDFSALQQSSPSAENSPPSDRPNDSRPHTPRIGYDYKTAIAVTKFMAFTGWAVSVIAALTFMTAIGSDNVFARLVVAPSIAALIGGFVLVVFSQNTRATIENTNYTREMLEIMRQQQTK